jgi:hypothetical protein
MRQSAGIVSGALDPGGEKGPAGNDVAEEIETLGIVIAVRPAHRASAAAVVRAVAPRRTRIATLRRGAVI